MQMHTKKPIRNSVVQWYVTKYCLSVRKHFEIILTHRGLIMRANVLLHSCGWKRPIVASCINPRPHCRSLGEQDRSPGAPPSPLDTSVPLALLWLALKGYGETHYLLCLNRLSYRLQWPTLSVSEAPNHRFTVKTAVLYKNNSFERLIMSYWHTGKLKIMSFLGKVKLFIQFSKMRVNSLTN